jgi:hypothetical protein
MSGSGVSSIGDTFNPQKGEINNGFLVDYFNAEKPSTLLTVNISNPVNANYGGAGVEFAMSDNKPACETILGVQICDDHQHNYLYKEYYLPGVGLCGFVHTGNYIYSGQYGYMTTRELDIWLEETNVK